MRPRRRRGAALPAGPCLLPCHLCVMSAPAPHAESSQGRWGLRLASGLPAKGMMTTISFQFNRVEEFTCVAATDLMERVADATPPTRRRHRRGAYQARCVRYILHAYVMHQRRRRPDVAAIRAAARTERLPSRRETHVTDDVGRSFKRCNENVCSAN